MSKLAPSVVALAATLALVATTQLAEAGNCNGGGHWKPAPQPVPTVRPITYPSPVYPAPSPTIHWRFGMSLTQMATQYGNGLMVTRVTPGGAASRAGLEPGDILLSSNGVSFRNASSNNHGVAMLQGSIGSGQSPVPTVTTTQVSTRIAPGYGQQPGVANLQVLDSRTGGVTMLAVYPQHNGAAHNGGAPAPTAAF